MSSKPQNYSEPLIFWFHSWDRIIAEQESQMYTMYKKTSVHAHVYPLIYFHFLISLLQDVVSLKDFAARMHKEFTQGGRGNACEIAQIFYLFSAV